MPSITTLSDLGLVNLGPLTTTFTAPQTCATPDQVVLRSDDFSAKVPYYWSECAVGDERWRSTCYPSGTELAKLYTSNDHSGYPYYSPGLVCPESWVTVGVAARDDEGRISSSGILRPFTTPRPSESRVYYNPVPNIFMQALDPGETLALCCPR